MIRILNSYDIVHHTCTYLSDKDVLQHLIRYCHATKRHRNTYRTKSSYNLNLTRRYPDIRFTRIHIEDSDVRYPRPKRNAMIHYNLISKHCKTLKLDVYRTLVLLPGQIPFGIENLIIYYGTNQTPIGEGIIPASVKTLSYDGDIKLLQNIPDSVVGLDLLRYGSHDVQKEHIPMTITTLGFDEGINNLCFAVLSPNIKILVLSPGCYDFTQCPLTVEEIHFKDSGVQIGDFLVPVSIKRCVIRGVDLLIENNVIEYEFRNMFWTTKFNMRRVRLGEWRVAIVHPCQFYRRYEPYTMGTLKFLDEPEIDYDLRLLADDEPEIDHDFT